MWLIGDNMNDISKYASFAIILVIVMFAVIFLYYGIVNKGVVSNNTTILTTVISTRATTINTSVATTTIGTIVSTTVQISQSYNATHNVHITKLYYNVTKPVVKSTSPNSMISNSISVNYTYTTDVGSNYTLVFGISNLTSGTLYNISTPSPGFKVENIIPVLPIIFNALNSSITLHLQILVPNKTYTGPLVLNINYT